MLFKLPSALLLTATLALGGALGTQAAAQGSMSPAQCDEVIMVGPQHFSATVLAACSTYFTSLADGAVSPGTFATVRPSTGVTLSTSGAEE